MLRIRIEGDRGEGKTTVAILIMRALRLLGFDAVYVSGDPNHEQQIDALSRDQAPVLQKLERWPARCIVIDPLDS